MTATIEMPDYCRRPGPLSFLMEARTPFQFFSFIHTAPGLLTAPRGDGRPVVLLPGYLAPELSMEPLAQYLKFLGYDVYPWGLGTNRGNVDEDIERLGSRVEDLEQTLGQQVTLIGWSLGGVVAREVTRLYADSVREVITLGTPIIGGPKYTSVGAFYARARGIDLDRFEEEVHERNSIGFTQPVTSVYSKTDGVVGWRASVDVYNAQADNIEVSGSHFGLGVNPKVWTIIARKLAETAEEAA